MAAPSPRPRRRPALRRGACRRAAGLDDGPEIVALGGADSSALPARHRARRRTAASADQPRLDAGRPAARRRGARSVDLIHAPAYTAPFWAGVARRAHDPRRQLRAPPGVVSVPARLGPPRVLPAQRPRRVAHPDRLVFSAAEITAAYHIPMRAITVAPLGVDAAFAHARSRRTPCELPAGRDHAVPAARRRPARAAQPGDARRCAAGGAPAFRRRRRLVARAGRRRSRRRRRALCHGGRGRRAGRRRAARVT